MRMFNVAAMALVAAAVVLIAFAARDAASAEPPAVWLSGLAQPMRDIAIHRRPDGYVEEAARFAGIDGAIGVLRLPEGALPPTRTLVARDATAFLREVRRRFDVGAETVRPLALARAGRLRAGYVARVPVGARRCDFAVAAYASGGGVGETLITAVARAVVCDNASPLTPPDIRLAGYLAPMEDAR